MLSQTSLYKTSCSTKKVLTDFLIACTVEAASTKEGKYDENVTLLEGNTFVNSIIGKPYQIE